MSYQRSHLAVILLRSLTLTATLWVLLLALLVAGPSASLAATRDWLQAQQTPSAPPPGAAAPSANASAPQVTEKVTHYTLPPDRWQKARNLGKFRFRFALLSFLYGLVALWIILRFKISAKYRSVAERASSARFVQALIFAPLIFLTYDVLTLPLNAYQQQVSRDYGLSVQGWGSWFGDWGKGEAIEVIMSFILVYLLYAVIRKWPRRWWFAFWLVSLPIGLLLFFLQPLIIDPLFNKFEPLQQKDPELVAGLEKLAQRAGQDIPPERMFWMNASAKTTAVDAYVTGFGASKRIVVLDTTIAKATTPQILFVAGHEMGHYVLGHVPKGIAFFATLFLVLFYIGYRSIGWVLVRWGERWDVRGVDDWASLPALLLLLAILSFITNPVASAFSRHDEHQADQYGLEVTHGINADANQAAAQGFVLLGNVDLGDPEPNPVDVFLFYSHPSIPDRVEFAVNYNPWSQGSTGEFVK